MWQLLNQCYLFNFYIFLIIQIQVPPTTSLFTTKDVRSAISHSTITRVASFILSNSPVTAISPSSVTPSHLSQTRGILASSSIVSQPGEQLFQSLLCQTVNNALINGRFTIDQSPTLVYVLLGSPLL